MYYTILSEMPKYILLGVIAMAYTVAHAYYFKECMTDNIEPAWYALLLGFSLHVFALVIIITHGNNYHDSDVIALMVIATLMLSIATIGYLTLIVRKFIRWVKLRREAFK